MKVENKIDEKFYCATCRKFKKENKEEENFDKKIFISHIF